MLSYDPPISHYGSVRTIPYSSSTSRTQLPPKMSNSVPRHLFIVNGPAGVGKTTVAQSLAAQFDYPFLEGDDYHTPENRTKMLNKIPLGDSDRWDWLQTLRREAVKKLNTGVPGVVMTCSALKEKYRDVIRIASYNNHNVRVHFVYLHTDAETLRKRILERSARTNHYMSAEMIKSQLADLEEPKEEEKDCITIDVGPSVDEVCVTAGDVVAGVIARDNAGGENSW